MPAGCQDTLQLEAIEGVQLPEARGGQMGLDQRVGVPLCPASGFGGAAPGAAEAFELLLHGGELDAAAGGEGEP